MVGEFVLDCSMSIAWCFGEEQTEYTRSVQNSFDRGFVAIVPFMWKLEIVNALRMAQKRGRVTEERQEDLLRVLCQMPIDTKYLEEDCMHLLSLCKKHDLTSYDASYLDLAIKFSAPIATLDSALQRAATKTGVGIYLM